MKIIVEIGTEEQKKLIEKELSVVNAISSHFEAPPKIAQIIVPTNFDDKVNESQGSNNYKSLRGHFAVAKNIFTNDGVCLIFSKHLFTNDHDNLTRLQIIFHEYVHAVNKDRFPAIETESASKKSYLMHLYALFDEYDANRKSFEVVGELFPDVSHRYKFNNNNHLKYFIKSLLDSNKTKKLREEISKFRLHADVNLFLGNIEPIFDELSMSIIYSFAYIDSKDKLKKVEPLLFKSDFINSKTEELICFYREKFNNGDPYLFDGVRLIEKFMKNFGIRLEDTSQGLYCHVLDI